MVVGYIKNTCFGHDAQCSPYCDRPLDKGTHVALQVSAESFYRLVGGNGNTSRYLELRYVLSGAARSQSVKRRETIQIGDELEAQIGVVHPVRKHDGAE